MNSSDIVGRIFSVLDRHLFETGRPAKVVRLGRSELRELRDYIHRRSLESTFGDPTGAKPTFDAAVIESVEAESFLSTELGSRRA